MAIAFRAVSAADGYATGTPTCVLPTGTLAGDIMIAFISGNAVFYSASAGWTQYGGNDDGSEIFYIKTATAADASGSLSPYGFGVTGGTGDYIINIISYSGSAGLDTYTQTTAYNSDSLTASSVTTTQSNELVLVHWSTAFFTDSAGSTDVVITEPGTVTNRYNAQYTGNSTYPAGVAIADYTGPSLPGSSSPGTATVPVGAAAGNIITSSTLTLKLSAPPLAPLLTAPANNIYSDLNYGPPYSVFSWTYNNGGFPSGSETGYDFRKKVSGGSYTYWNGTTFQSTDVTNTSSALSLTFSAGVWPDGLTYNWSVASTDGGGKGPFATDFTANASSVPSVVVSPNYTNTQTPIISWTPTLNVQSTQLSYQVITYNSTQYTSGTFVAGSGPYVDNSGVIYSTATSYTVATFLTNGTAYRSYVQIVQTPGNQTSSWTYTTGYTISTEPPNTPTITSVYGTDPSTGCPRIVLTVTTQDNILSALDSSFESGLGTTAAITNCSVTTSTVEAEYGTHSMRMDATASGNMSAGTATGTSGYAVLGSTTYTIMSSYWAATTVRSCRTDCAWYTSGGSLISTTTGTPVTDATGAWTNSLVTVVSPSNAAYARIIHNVLSTGGGTSGEIHYVDGAGIFPGTVTATQWDLGGFVGASDLVITRSDGNQVRYFSSANPGPVTVPSQITVGYDYEAVPGTEYTYTAQTISGVFASAVSTASPEAEVPTGLGFWELDPTNYPSATNAQPTAWNIQNYEQSAAHPVLGQNTVNVVASVMQIPDVNASFSVFTAAIYQSLYNLLTSQKTLFISDPFGFGYYFRMAPAPGGLSAGTGNKANDATLNASSSSGPYRVVAATGIGQPRPQV